MGYIKRNCFFLAQLVLFVLIGWPVYSALCQFEILLANQILTISPPYCLLLLFSIYTFKKYPTHPLLKKTLWGIGVISIAYTGIAFACYFFLWGNFLWYAFLTSMIGVLLLEASFFCKRKKAG